MANRGQLRTSIMNLCGNHSQLTSSVVDEFLTTEDREILEARDWERRYTTTMVAIAAPVTGGTVSITQGSSSVVGVGTAFTAAMVGRFIRIAGMDSFYKITAYTDANNITIEGVWSEASQAGANYSIFHTIITLPSDCEKVIEVKGRRNPMLEGTVEMLNVLDPMRKSTAATDPVYWANTDRDPNGLRQIEIWPPVSAAQPLRLRYERVVDLGAGDSSTPLYRSDLLKWKAASDAAAFLYAKTGDGAWANLGQNWYALYEKALEEETINDLSKSSPKKAAAPMHGGVINSSEFLIDHDPWSP